MKKIIVLMSLIAPTLSLAAQPPPDSAAIHSYMRWVDSLAEHDHQHQFVQSSISEGPISAGYRLLTDDGKDSVYDVRGGFGRYCITNPAGDSLYRFIYHDNIAKNFYEIYYYQAGQLVYAELRYEEDGIGEVFFQKKAYYHYGSLISVTESEAKLVEPYSARGNKAI